MAEEENDRRYALEHVRGCKRKGPVDIAGGGRGSIWKGLKGWVTGDQREPGGVYMEG